MSVYVIAEIGINHNGDLQIAKDLIKIAKEAGANAVKFQKRDLNLVYTSDYLLESRESPWGNTQRDQKEGLEFSEDQYISIDSYCKDLGIDWFASAWDINSQKFLGNFDCKYNKVASALLTYRELLEEIASQKKHTFISTGMSTLEQIDKAVKIFEDAGFQWREPGCSLCFYAGGEGFLPQQRVITSTNRNFRGRQGNGVRSHLASPVTVAASAIAGKIVPPQTITKQ